MKLLIKDVRVGDLIRDIFIRDGVITDISPKCGQRADRVINGRDKAALPSFINGHTHAAMTLFRGFADDMPLKQWLEEKIWVLEAKLTEEDVYWGTKLACLEMIKNGVTVFNDMYWHFESTARAAHEMGLRAIVSAVLIDMFDRRRSEEQIHKNVQLFQAAQKYGPQIRFALGPHAIYTVSGRSLEWVKEFSEENECLIHMHLCETEEELRFAEERYGVSPVRFLAGLGLLSPRFIGCHGCWLDADACEILAQTKTRLVHNPVSNLKLSVGRLFPYHLMKQHNIPYCFGTDGCSSNNHLDIIETMKFASLLAKFSTNDPTFLSAGETFDRATIVAAETFSLGDWEITEGSAADIILIDLARAEMVPNFHIYSDIVYASNGSVVDTVIAMGRVLMENRYVEGEETILREAKKRARELVER
ncbi:MAG TPA: amidohydrolase [Syntrophorhabdales bacterium]|nr:amidohydrolase [Syntrophorhabdales bacterium]